MEVAFKTSSGGSGHIGEERVMTKNVIYDDHGVRFSERRYDGMTNYFVPYANLLFVRKVPGE